MTITPNHPLFEPGTIGPVTLRNRFVRAGTSEGMVDRDGYPTDQLVQLYGDLARNNVGLIITGHMYVDPRGQYNGDQTAIDRDELIPALRRLTDEVHRYDGRVFAQLSHAGSQSILARHQAIAPSAFANPITGRQLPAASVAEIEATIVRFGEAAERAVAAGFDGVHLHAANGYLISQFSSPVSNQRTDRWGGSPDNRSRFALEVVKRVQSMVPPDFAVTAKLGLADTVPGGMDLSEGTARARLLVEAGLDGIEASCNLMTAYTDNIRTYVAVDRRRALSDLLVRRILVRKPEAEAYFRPWGKQLKEAVDAPVILVGGLRTVETMTEIVENGDADFVALARPFIREPDLVRRIENDLSGSVGCTSCNLCLMHVGQHPLQCWRTPRRRLIQHAISRLRT